MGSYPLGVSRVRNDEAKGKALGRLRRIEGQVQGLQRMIDNDAYCVDILLQISAVQGALEQVQKLLLGRHIESCVADALRSGSTGERQQKIEELLDVFALRRVPGVETATVNLATERATVAFDPARAAVPALQAAVEAAGYELDAGPVETGGATGDRERAERAEEDRRLRARVVVGSALSLPLLVGGMPELFPWAPAWLRDPWLQLALATPVVLWVGADFHAGFLRDLRHRTASMSTLVSLGTGAAYLFSLAVTLWPHVFHAAGAMPYYEPAPVAT